MSRCQGQHPGRDRKGHYIALMYRTLVDSSCVQWPSVGQEDDRQSGGLCGTAQSVWNSIASFGAIQLGDLAEMAIRTYMGESATYRTAGAMRDIVTGLLEKGETPEMAKLKAAEEYH